MSTPRSQYILEITRAHEKYRAAWDMIHNTEKVIKDLQSHFGSYSCKAIVETSAYSLNPHSEIITTEIDTKVVIDQLTTNLGGYFKERDRAKAELDRLIDQGCEEIW